MSDQYREWHRLFGLLLFDFFTDSPYRVDLEQDLSLKQQLLDVVIVRARRGRFAGQLPDGLNDLGTYNLITFKSFQEALDDWALKELTGHNVNYRKKISPKNNLLPESDFRLYAVCSRYPHNLAGAVRLEPLSEGVYRCRRGTDMIQVVVAGELPQSKHNAPLHLFSASAEQVEYGARHFRQRSEDTSRLLRTLFERYRGEGVVMPYTIEDFRKAYVLEHFQELTAEEKRKALEGMSEAERQEALKGLSPEERMAGLSIEEIEAFLNRRKAESPPPRKTRRK